MGNEIEWTIPLDFPFDWKLKLKFAILPEKPTPCIIKNGAWMRALRMNKKLIPIIVKSTGKIEKPKLIVSTSKLFSHEKRKIIEFVFNFHGIKDAAALYAFMDRDPVLKKIKGKLYGFGRAGLMSATVFEGVIKAIIQQQISLRVAASITANLVKKYGEKIKFRQEYFYEFPSAERLANLSLNEFRKCGLSWKKAEYVKEFSLAVLNGFNPEDLRNKGPEEILEILTSFREIGRWTAELVMVASMKLNIIPADDLGVRKAISHFYFKDKVQSPENIRRFAENKFGEFMRDCLVYMLMAYRMRL
jgi:DNA-3-methyladenine glycosylase II